MGPAKASSWRINNANQSINLITRSPLGPPTSVNFSFPLSFSHSISLTLLLLLPLFDNNQSWSLLEARILLEITRQEKEAPLKNWWPLFGFIKLDSWFNQTASLSLTHSFFLSFFFLSFSIASSLSRNILSQFRELELEKNRFLFMCTLLCEPLYTAPLLLLSSADKEAEASEYPLKFAPVFVSTSRLDAAIYICSRTEAAPPFKWELLELPTCSSELAVDVLLWHSPNNTCNMSIHIEEHLTCSYIRAHISWSSPESFFPFSWPKRGE